MVHAAYADRISVLRYDLGNRGGAGALHGLDDRRESTDMRCLDTIARYLFYTFVIDFSLEMLDLVQRTYEADESFRSLDFHGAYAPVDLTGGDSNLPGNDGAAVPPGDDATLEIGGKREARPLRRGQLSDTHRHPGDALECGGGRPALLQEFLGYTSYKVRFAAREGLLPAIRLMILPFVLFYILVKLLPPWQEQKLTEA